MLREVGEVLLLRYVIPGRELTRETPSNPDSSLFIELNDYVILSGYGLLKPRDHHRLLYKLRLMMLELERSSENNVVKTGPQQLVYACVHVPLSGHCFSYEDFQG